jgi:phasin
LVPDERSSSKDTRAMAEATATSTTTEAKPAFGAFEVPKFDFPNFEMPRIDMPAAFREFAEKGTAQAKETYERMKAAAEESTAVLENTYATAAKGVTDYNLKLIECARANTNAVFDFAGQFIAAKSLSEALELSTVHTRKQFETMAEQGKELTALAQKTAADVAEPIKTGVSSAFNKAA